MNNWTTEQIAEARRIVARVRDVQESRRLKDRALLEEYPDLGSTKSWRHRLLAEDYAGLNPGRTLERLRRVDRILDGDRPDQPFYRELPFAIELLARLRMLEQSTTDRRILAALAPNGCGKTSFALWAVGQARAKRTYVRMMPGWRNRGLHIANGIATALDGDGTATNSAEAEQRLVGLLRGQTRTIFVDQAHEGGPALMHLIRALVDETPARFVYLGYDTAFRRVLAANSDAMIEAQAFLGRCLKPVFDGYRRGTTPRDCLVYLQVAAGLSPSVASGIATRVTPILARSTNLRLLDDAITAARAGSEDDEAAADKIVSEVYRLAGLDPIQATQPQPEEE